MTSQGSQTLDDAWRTVETQTVYSTFPNISHHSTTEATEQVLNAFEQLNRRSPLFRNNGEALVEVNRCRAALQKYIGQLRGIVNHYATETVPEGQRKVIKQDLRRKVDNVAIPIYNLMDNMAANCQTLGACRAPVHIIRKQIASIYRERIASLSVNVNMICPDSMLI